MDLSERELRDLLFSPYGKNCGESLLALPETEHGLTVTLANGTTRIATDRESALLLLEEVFQWTPDKAS